MSTASVNASKLSPAQLQANRSAIHSYLKTAAKKFGNGTVILLPEFSEDSATGVWSPVQGHGVRLATNQRGVSTGFFRLGKVAVVMAGSSMKEVYTYSNVFGAEGQSAEEVCEGLLALDPNCAIGMPIKGVRLVVHESLVPFSRTNPTRDIKQTPDGIVLVKYVPDDQGVVKECPIYRTTKVFTCDEAGNYPPQAINQLIQHDNGQQLSDAAYARFAQANKANTPAIVGAAPTV